MKIRKSLPEFTHEIEGAEFKMRPLSEIELEQVNYLLIDMIKEGHQVLPPKAVCFILDKCLVDWSGVEDEQDKPLPYSSKGEEYLPFAVRMELSSVAYTSSVINEDEKKS
jgi:hypothetical protein